MSWVSRKSQLNPRNAEVTGRLAKPRDALNYEEARRRCLRCGRLD
jgi:hypothetical protein